MYTSSVVFKIKNVTLTIKPKTEIILFQLTARTNGWVGIGFGIGETMAGADLIIGGVRDGAPYIWVSYHIQYMQLELHRRFSAFPN